VLKVSGDMQCSAIQSLKHIDGSSAGTDFEPTDSTVSLICLAAVLACEVVVCVCTTVNSII